MKSYGQHCPVAQAAEILNQRWTILIVRDILYGARRFNEIRRFLPLISPTLLSQRLRHLERVGIIERRHDETASIVEYVPTQAAQELLPVVETLGAWGQRWVRNRLTEDDLDVSFLMHGIHYVLEVDSLPLDQCVIEFHFKDRPPLSQENWRMDRWWLVVAEGNKELCLHDPELDVDLAIQTDLRSLTRFFMGDFGSEEALISGALELDGDQLLIDCFDEWMPRSHFRYVPPAPDPIDFHALLQRSPAASIADSAQPTVSKK
jgi:DNA-binding HxlR family transcriptional regulator